MIKIKQIAVNNNGLIVGIDEEGIAYFWDYKDGSWELLTNIYKNFPHKPKHR